MRCPKAQHNGAVTSGRSAFRYYERAPLRYQSSSFVIEGFSPLSPIHEFDRPALTGFSLPYDRRVVGPILNRPPNERPIEHVVFSQWTFDGVIVQQAVRLEHHEEACRVG